MFLRLDWVLLTSLTLTESGVGFTSFSERRLERRARVRVGEGRRETEGARGRETFSYSSTGLG